MLEDKSLKQYVSWSKSKGKDAVVIPDIEAFVANALPKHFEEMKQWGSFQKQLNNYDFKRQDRGPNKAVYAHSMFLQGRPDLLGNVRCRPKHRTPGHRGPKRPSTLIPPTAGNTPPASGSQTDSPSHNDQLERDNKELKRKVSELELRVQTLETRLQLMEMREQLNDWSKRPEGISTGGGALDSMVDPGSAQSVHQIDVLHGALIASADAGGEALGCQFGPLQTLPWEAYLTTELPYDPVDPLFGLEFLAP
ncbi:hypothetical protein FRC00_001428 [Tulasnella sp. 408]|nr:hypothetical protein FRC00_001428 [Tulasnella sp. 408]